jgi:hypothetical protein
MKGKHHNHARPGSHIRLGSHAPTLRIDQRLDNRQAQVEPFKQAWQVNP